MTVDYRVISAGAMSAHPLWNEGQDVRAAHTTTTLVSSGDAHIIVDPSLPGQMLGPRMAERANLKPGDITHVFFTSLEPVRRRGVGLFPNAAWLASEREIDAARASVEQQFEDQRESGNDDELMKLIQSEQELLSGVQPAEDAVASGVDLFPLPGVTDGACGLLIALPGSTVLITGDAIATIDHLQQGKVLPTCVDLQQAQESFREALEIADAFVLGRDGLVLNPVRSGTAGMPASGIMPG